MASNEASSARDEDRICHPVASEPADTPAIPADPGGQPERNGVTGDPFFPPFERALGPIRQAKHVTPALESRNRE